MAKKTTGDAVAKPAPEPKRKAKGLQIVSWALSRKDGGRWVRCYWHEDGERKQTFPPDPPPSVKLIGERWGSGEYKLTLIKAGGGMGGGGVVTVDNPKLPTKPSYPNRPAAEAAAAPAAAADRNNLSALMAMSKDDPMAMLMVYRALDRDARFEANREAEQRVQRILADTSLTIEREREHSKQENERARIFYDALLRAGRSGPAEDDDDVDEDDDTSDRLALLEERVSGSAEPKPESGADFALRQVGALIATLKDRPEVMGVVLEKLGLGGAK